jgi:hypothetical protein
MMSVPGLLLAGLALCQTVAFADVSLTLTGTNNNSEGGVYTSPYLISVNNSSSSQWLVCDDFETDISIGDSWTAEVNSVSSAATGGKFKAPASPTYTYLNTTDSLAQDYEAAALLAVQILQHPLDNSGTNEDYSYALWNIFDTNAIPTLANSDSGDATTALAYETEALTWAQNPSNTSGLSSELAADVSLVNDVVIYTPVDANGAVIPPGVPYTSGGSGASQEFFGLSNPVPEGSTVAFLLFDFLVALGAFFMLRKRLVRHSTAKS